MTEVLVGGLTFPEAPRWRDGTLWFSGIALVVLIGGISWFVLRSVTIPIAEAAETSVSTSPPSMPAQP